MSAAEIRLSIVMPALNEERNLPAALTDCLRALDASAIPGEIIVVNDGSSDGTAATIADWKRRDGRVRSLAHDSPRGIGASFWDGVDAARGSAVVMLPGDNENDPDEIFQYLGVLEHVDVVIPFVFNKSVRSFYRNTLSYVYRLIVNSTFLVNFNYTNGTNLYRTSVLRELDKRSTGFFFQTDILVRLVRKGYLFAEVPYRLGVRKGGASIAATFPSFLQVARGYLRLVKDVYWDDTDGFLARHTPDSATSVRRRERPR